MELELPPWKVFTKAIALIWEKRGFAFHVCLPLIVLHALLGLAMDLGFVDLSPARRALGEPAPTFALERFGWKVGLYLVTAFFVSIIAVYWHRSILLGEDKAGIIPFRLDGPLLRYILFAVGIGLFTVFVFGGMAFLAGVLKGLVIGETSRLTSLLLFAPLLLWIGVVVFRLSLVLPAAAIGEPEFGFRAAWRISRGTGWAIVALILLQFGLLLLIALPFLLIMTSADPKVMLDMVLRIAALPDVLTQTFSALLTSLQTLLSIGLLSLAYAYLTYGTPRTTSMLRTWLRRVLIVFVVYAAAYGVFRQTHIEVWENDDQPYVIFPTGSLGKAMYYAWRPLTYADAALTGMRFHIGPHQ